MELGLLGPVDRLARARAGGLRRGARAGAGGGGGLGVGLAAQAGRRPRRRRTRWPCGPRPWWPARPRRRARPAARGSLGLLQRGLLALLGLAPLALLLGLGLLRRRRRRPRALACSSSARRSSVIAISARTSAARASASARSACASASSRAAVSWARSADHSRAALPLIWILAHSGGSSPNARTQISVGELRRRDGGQRAERRRAGPDHIRRLTMSLSVMAPESKRAPRRDALRGRRRSSPRCSAWPAVVVLALLEEPEDPARQHLLDRAVEGHRGELRADRRRGTRPSPCAPSTMSAIRW